MIHHRLSHRSWAAPKDRDLHLMQQTLPVAYRLCVYQEASSRSQGELETLLQMMLFYLLRPIVLRPPISRTRDTHPPRYLWQRHNMTTNRTPLTRPPCQEMSLSYKTASIHQSAKHQYTSRLRTLMAQRTRIRCQLLIRRPDSSPRSEPPARLVALSAEARYRG